MGEELSGFFEGYLDSDGLFNDKKALQTGYAPETILHREEQINQVAQVLAPLLRLERPSNLFVYGKTGTGKTLSIKHVTGQLIKTATNKNVPLKLLYLNCKLKRIADTEYRLLAELARGLGSTVPSTGLPTDEVYKTFFNKVDEQEQLVLLVLDEVDQLIKKTGDGILYNLTRINEDLRKSQLAIVGISNTPTFIDHLDPRVKSSLSEEEIVFPPYNALQIQDILKARAKIALKEGALQQGLIEKCAAYAAREHGDARRALELLRVAAELAERSNQEEVKIGNLDEAEAKIENDQLLEIVTTQPKQSQATLFSILSIYSKKKEIITGEVYELYKQIVQKQGLRALTQRRVSDIIAELDMLGILNTQVISKGRYGRTREITLSMPIGTIAKAKKVLEESLDLS